MLSYIATLYRGKTLVEGNFGELYIFGRIKFGKRGQLYDKEKATWCSTGAYIYTYMMLAAQKM